ncbi:sensor histidine kinase [Geobacter pickeringii]|uniref:sensor histidine kinase n=1 Tax=Geobacter pickeringii TaxID=345632 RepID=UPI00068CDAD6|nr:ATP-binding protein [Geobacter pickeringii]
MTTTDPEEARLTAERDAAVADLAAFSSAISHDLRGPLRTISVAVQILASEHAAGFDDEARTLLSIVENNAGRMGGLIDDIVAFSRVSRQRLQKLRIDMNEMAEAVIAGITSPTEGRRVSFAVDPLPPAAGDPELVRQLLAQLISNAVKFTRPRDEAVIQVGVHGDGTYFVRDNGVGFDMAHTGQLFGLFHRLHHKDEFEGNGVGLALVKRIAEKHGGRVWAEGVPGEGATFYFTL